MADGVDINGNLIKDLGNGKRAPASVVTAVTMGALGSGTSKRAKLSIGTSVVVIHPPFGAWKSCLVINNHATAILSVNVNADPTDSSGSPPDIIFGDGQDIPPGDAAMISLVGTLTDIRLVSDKDPTPVIINLTKEQ